MEYDAIPTSIWKRKAACPLDIQGVSKRALQI
jgi:hypothetical protein